MFVLFNVYFAMFSHSTGSSITRQKPNINNFLDLGKFETLEAKAFIMSILGRSEINPCKYNVANNFQETYPKKKP